VKLRKGNVQKMNGKFYGKAICSEFLKRPGENKNWNLSRK
jgi:hypothetical protein